MKLSICIPTYNRAKRLENCLTSIFSEENLDLNQIEICVSDNGSQDNTSEVVERLLQKFKFKYNRNEFNEGIPKNFLKVVSMATGEFAWLVGDDDLIPPGALTKLLSLLNREPNIDFFYINSYHLTTEFVDQYPFPFDTKNLPINMERFSKHERDEKLKFFKLIDAQYSFDFLGGMFLSVFKREKWLANTNSLNTMAINDLNTFSHFDNTFPHIRIFANAFRSSDAYFHAEPLSVCLSGAREWSPMYTFVRSVRIVEAIDIYRQNGLGLFQYLKCKNVALSFFIPDILSIYLFKNRPGKQFVSLRKLILQNFLFPNFYLSAFYYLTRKIKFIVSNLLQ